MEIRELQAAIEAMLFACGEAVSLDKLADALEIDKGTTEKLVSNLAERLEQEERGLCILKLEDAYQMCSKPQYGERIRKLMDIHRNVPLSPASMEVLAIVAYNQPVTKSFVEQIRGVDCSGVLSSLMTKGLLEEKGRLELPGKPLLYGTTSNFLRCFGIVSLDDLPPLPEKESVDMSEGKIPAEKVF